MTQKVLSIKVEPNNYDQFKAFAKGYKTQAEAFSALMQLVSIPKLTAQNPTQSKGIPNVCVLSIGTKLDIAWELKPHTTDKVLGRQWYVYTQERVVAIKAKSANGAKTWLEVAKQYPEAVWIAAIENTSFKYDPIKTLEDYLTGYDKISQFEQQPTIAEAIAKGWTYKWVSLRSDALQSDITEGAEKYLNSLPLPVVDAVDTGVKPATQPEVDVLEPQAISRADLADRLAAKHLELGTAKTDKAKANELANLPLILKDMKLKNCNKWSSARDPEGKAWQPTDDTREEWLPQ